MIFGHQAFASTYVRENDRRILRAFHFTIRAKTLVPTYILTSISFLAVQEHFLPSLGALTTPWLAKA